MLDIVKKLFGVFIAILYKLTPKKDIVLFHSDLYRDNAKYLYEHIKGKTDYSLVWILNDKKLVRELNKNGIRAVHSLSLKCALTCARLKMIITTNFPPIATMYINPIIVQVFHGFGTKQNPTDYVYNRQIKQVQKQLRNIDYIICLSKRDNEYFFPKEKLQIDDKYPEYLPLGLPRNDMLVDSTKMKICTKKLIETFRLKSNQKVILYAPTWREKPEGSDFSDYWFFDKKETEKFEFYLRKGNYMLFLRPHHHCLRDISFRDKIMEITNEYPNTFKFAGADIWSDTQEILCTTDILITDFSSIYVDYLLTNRPIIYLDMDTEDYVKHRGLVIDYYNDLHTPGPKVRSLDQIINYLEELGSGIDKYENIRKKSLYFYHDNADGNSTERVGKLVLELL